MSAAVYNSNDSFCMCRSIIATLQWRSHTITHVAGQVVMLGVKT